MHNELDAENVPAFADPERKPRYPGTERPIFDYEFDVALPDADVGVGAELDTAPDAPDAPIHAIRSRYLAIARLHVCNKTNTEIAEILGYSASRISIILREPYVQREIARYRNAFFDQTVADAIKEAGRDGVAYIHRVINDPTEKTQYRIDASKWSADKAYGKARQEIAVESGSLNAFIDLANRIIEQREVLDVTPSLPTAGGQPNLDVPTDSKVNQWGAWLDANL